MSDFSHTFEWNNGERIVSVTIPHLSFESAEVERALEEGAVVVLDSNGNLAFTCVDHKRLDRVKTVGDTVIYPSGEAYVILA